MKRFAWLAIGLVLAAAPREGSGALLDGIGAMGDSLTDEYEGSSLSAGRNWLEQLVRARGLNFGAFSSTARAEPRRTGYEYNWARSGATSDTLISEGQHTGLADQVAQGKVTLAYLGIGSNDFGFAYLSIYAGLTTGAALDALIDDVAANVTKAVDEVTARGPVKLVIGNIPDYGIAPTLRLLFSDPARRQRVTDATSRANAKIAALADARGIPIVDLFSFANTIFVSEGQLVVGGVNIALASGDDPRNLFLSDGIHPGSVAQGLIGNAFLEAIRAAYGSTVTARSDQEILRDAGIAPPAGADTFYDVKRFVRLPSTSPILLSQVAVGGGYSTVFTLANTGGVEAGATLSLTDSSGDALTATWTGGASTVEGSSIAASVPAGGVRVYTASRSSGELRSGWARLDVTSGTLHAVGTFQASSGGSLQTIAGVLGAKTTTAATIPIDNDDAARRYTGFAVANPSDETITIRLVTLAQDGSILDDVTDDRLKLGPRRHAALFLHQILSARLNFRGSAVLVGQSGKTFAVVALVEAQGLLTAIPVVPEKPPAVSN